MLKTHTTLTSTTLSLIMTSLVFFSASTLANEDNKLCGHGIPSDTDKDRAFQSCFYGLFGAGVTLLDPEGTSNGWSDDNKPSIGGSVGVGWDISTHWFTELKYTYLGEAELKNSNPVVDDAIDAAIKYQAPSLMLGRKLISDSDNFNAYVKIGASWISNKENDSSINYDEESKAQASLGAGIRFYLSDSPWFMDFVWDAFSKDANMVGVQFGRYFGHTQKASHTETSPSATEMDSPQTGMVSPKTGMVSPATDHPAEAMKVEPILPDKDMDGVPDNKDRCPFTSMGTKVGPFGCCLPEDGCTVSFPEQ